MHRRLFLQASLTTAASLAQLPRQTEAHAARLPDPKPGKLPRWRGFNLLEKFVAGTTVPEPEGPYQERDFDSGRATGREHAETPPGILTLAERISIDKT